MVHRLRPPRIRVGLVEKPAEVASYKTASWARYLHKESKKPRHGLKEVAGWMEVPVCV